MASQARSASDHLTYLQRGAASVHALEPLQFLRGAEARAPALPRIGASRLPAQNVVDLAQTPSLAFPAATLESVRIDGDRARVEGHWLGLTGPMAPLPLHLSEFASYERRYSRQRPFGAFLDVLAGRMLQFFYRAWALTNPATSSDRPLDDFFSESLTTLTGAGEGVGADTPFPARARLRYAALYVGTRSATHIQDALTDLLRAPVRIVENIGRWRDVVPEDRTSLGRGLATLARDAIGGGRVRTVSDAFRVVVTISSARELAEMLPGGRRYALLTEAIEAFAPPHLDWDVELEAADAAIRPARLGGGTRLGWSSWTGRPAPGSVRADARLGHGARAMAKRIEESKT